VFHESDPEELHARHPFSNSRPASLSSHEATASDGAVASSTAPDTALDVAALDCEMVYTTGGLRVARVSVVDGSGTTVFDELVRMDDGVDVMLVASISFHKALTASFSQILFSETATTTLDFLGFPQRSMQRLFFPWLRYANP
jgi:hypothetical protein